MNKLDIKPALVILDRDGVINADPKGYISTPDEWQALPGSLEAIARLNALGIQVAVASNQSGVARGFFDKSALERITHRMEADLAAVGGHLDFIAYCPHHPIDECACRKPQIGLLQQISKALHIPLSTHVWFVGDSERDILAALAAFCTPILVKTGNGSATLARKALEKCPVFENLAAVVHYIDGLS